jgi:hypothetical protein
MGRSTADEGGRLQRLVMRAGGDLGIEIRIPDSSPADDAHIRNDVIIVQLVETDLPDLWGPTIHWKIRVRQQLECIVGRISRYSEAFQRSGRSLNPVWAQKVVPWHFRTYSA